MSRTSAYSLNIATDSKDVNAIILLVDGALVAMLVELSDESHADNDGNWIIEALFGVDNARPPDGFASPESAADWVSSNICGHPFILGKDIVPLR